ncbi:hypothetical protein V8E51_010089 [Hyaloscypha variabilis]
MPKKRFMPQYSKPQSTVHPSLQSPATASSSSSTNHIDAPPTVNDLISTLRKSSLQTNAPAPSTITTKTLPPQIRHLLSEPETPGPKPRARDRRRFDANGQRIAAGPAPPKSWLQNRHASTTLAPRRGDGRTFPNDVRCLPGLGERGRGERGKRLQDMCLRAMARDWEFIHEYERNNLADLPVGVRMLLLSYIAVYGPEEGVGFEGLKSLLVHPVSENEDEDWERTSPGEHNEGFFRLDISGAIGRSVSFKQLTELILKSSPTAIPSSSQPPADLDLSWEESFTRSLSPPIPHLTHLSLSHPPQSISWPRFLTFASHIPTLTHLSLAFWPVPSLTPNARTAVVTSRFGKDIQYGGTGFYSHTLDNDFREASDVLRRVAGKLYGLEYLDLTGCGEWLRALRWEGNVGEGAGIDWGSQWVKLHTLKLSSGLELREESEYSDVVAFVQAYKEVVATEECLRWWMRDSKVGRAGGGRRAWIWVVKDDLQEYEELWQGEGTQERKRKALDALKEKGGGTQGWRSPIVFEDGLTDAILQRSLWEQ